MSAGFLRILPVLLAAVVYLPSLSFERTLDDVSHIYAPGETDLRSFSEVWSEPYWERGSGGGLYRPVTTTTFWLENRLSLPLGVRHGWNLLLHAAVTGLVVLLASGLGLPAAAAATAGVLFAIHPVHVEAVAGLVGRAELLAALWMLIALGLHDHRLRTGTPAGGAGRQGLRTSGAFLLSFLAAGSKESAWLLPAFALGLHAARKRSLRGAEPVFAGYFLGIGAHLLLRYSVLGGWLNMPGAAASVFENPLVELEGIERTLGGLRVLGVYLLHLVLPPRLSPDYAGDTIPLTGVAPDSNLLAGVLFLAGAACLFLAGFGRGRPESRSATVAGAWLLLSASVTLNLFLTLETLVADRLLYFPSVAWCLLAGSVVARATGVPPGRNRLRRPASVAMLVILALGFAWYARGLAAYLPAWKNNETLFAHGVRATPRSPLVWSGYGRALAGKGDFEGALSAYRRLQSMYPTYSSAWGLEAAALIDQGRFEEARRPLAEAKGLDPGDPLVQLLEGMLRFHDGHVEEAAERFREILAAEPGNGPAAWHLALALQGMGNPVESAEAWRAYLRIDPGSAAALNNLAWNLATELDQPAEAESLARKAVDLDPSNLQYRDTLAEALLRQGKRTEAARVAREAREFGPSGAEGPDFDRFEPGSAADSAGPGAGDRPPG